MSAESQELGMEKKMDVAKKPAWQKACLFVCIFKILNIGALVGINIYFKENIVFLPNTQLRLSLVSQADTWRHFFSKKHCNCFHIRQIQLCISPVGWIINAVHKQ